MNRKTVICWTCQSSWPIGLAVTSSVGSCGFEGSVIKIVKNLRFLCTIIKKCRSLLSAESIFITKLLSAKSKLPRKLLSVKSKLISWPTTLNRRAVTNCRFGWLGWCIESDDDSPNCKVSLHRCKETLQFYKRAKLYLIDL